MIQPNEVRIGNYVNVTNKNQCPFRIDAFDVLSRSVIKVSMDNIINGVTLHPLTWYGEDISPIPLTEEWLLKFGFIEYSYLMRLKSTYFYLLCFEGYYWYTPDEDHRIGEAIKYVHQLQNLFFALTQQELEITNE